MSNIVMIIKLLIIFYLKIIFINGEKCFLRENNYQWQCNEIVDMNDVFTVMKSSVTEIIIENYKINKFYLNEFSTSNLSRQITSLDYAAAGILIISINSLKPFTSLTNLNLSSVAINQLQSNWFNENNNIDVFDISRNKLISLDRNSLMPLKNVRVANFSHNFIATIEKNSFNEWQNLQELLLQNNYIEALHDLGFLRQLKILNVEGNFLRKVIPLFFIIYHKIINDNYCRLKQTLLVRCVN